MTRRHPVALVAKICGNLWMWTRGGREERRRGKRGGGGSHTQRDSPTHTHTHTHRERERETHRETETETHGNSGLKPCAFWAVIWACGFVCGCIEEGLELCLEIGLYCPRLALFIPKQEGCSEETGSTKKSSFPHTPNAAARTPVRPRLKVCAGLRRCRLYD